jgi:hypothetical protein
MDNTELELKQVRRTVTFLFHCFVSYDFAEEVARGEQHSQAAVRRAVGAAVYNAWYILVKYSFIKNYSMI